jgi:hypothetical protein
VEKLLNISGVMNTMKLRTGQIHTVGSKPAPAAAVPIADETEVVEPVEAAEPAVTSEEPAVAEAASAGGSAAETATEEE